MKTKPKKKSDRREPVWAKQRQLRGFDDRETWSLDNTIAKFVLPRLKRFVSVSNGHPGNITEAEWKKILRKMVRGFELLADGAWALDDKQHKQVDESMKLFAEWCKALWW